MTDTLKILIIDDNEDDRLMYRRTLRNIRSINHTIIEADSGETALGQIGKEQPSCVLLDYSMPGMDGLSVLKKLRGSHPFMPVIMLTGQGNESVAADAIRAGAQNYVVKAQIAPDLLEQVISMAVHYCAMQKRVDDQRNALEVFSRALAHDLKEPVRTVHAFAELIGQRETLSEKGMGNLQHIRNAANRMKALIESVVAYTRLEDHDPPANEPCDFSDILKEAGDNLAQLVGESGAQIRCYDVLPVIHARRIQMIQLLQNLISNAIRHGKEGVEIELGARQEEGRWQFCVSDNGPGIEAAYLQKIFEPFKRLDHADTQGSGLGLAICRRIVEQHGGKIWCESEPGSGAKFFFTLPSIEEQVRTIPSPQHAA